MSATRARKGCIVTLNERSMKSRMKAPMARGAKASSRGQLGMRANASAETIEPPRM